MRRKRRKSSFVLVSHAQPCSSLTEGNRRKIKIVAPLFQDYLKYYTAVNFQVTNEEYSIH